MDVFDGTFCNETREFGSHVHDPGDAQLAGQLLDGSSTARWIWHLQRAEGRPFHRHAVRFVTPT